TDRERLKADIVWNVEAGLELDASRIAAAELARGELFHSMNEFLAGYELLLCPSACVAPFDVSTRWVHEVEGVAFETYIDWLRICWATPLASCRVVALPWGFTEDGLPVGLQVVGRPRGEWRLLQAAAAIEEVFGVAGRVPLDPRSPP